MHPFLLQNGEIHSTTSALISPGQVGFLSGWGIFSTLRVKDGVLFEFNRHCARMRHDARLLRIPIEWTNEELHRNLQKLIAANHATNATLRVSVVRNKGGLFEAPGITRETDTIAFTADLRNWGTGVKLSYTPHTRHGKSPFAGVKTTSWAMNLAMYDDAHARGFDECILLNEDEQVSECTSANIFAIVGDEVWTPPLSTSGCLPGVTRAVLLDEIQVPGLRIFEREITPSELEGSDQVFITSSTRDLLPVAEIDGAQLAQSPDVFRALREAFQSHLLRYVAAHQPVSA